MKWMIIFISRVRANFIWCDTITFFAISISFFPMLFTFNLANENKAHKERECVWDWERFSVCVREGYHERLREKYCGWERVTEWEIKREKERLWMKERQCMCLRERKRYVSNVNLVTNYHCIFIFSSKNLALKNCSTKAVQTWKKTEFVYSRIVQNVFDWKQPISML